MSSGFGGWNLGQALEKIDSMPMPEAKKEVWRSTAEFYDKFKSTKAGKVAELIKVAFPSVERKKIETRIEMRWKTEKCKGCMHIGDKKFCYLHCKNFRKERG